MGTISSKSEPKSRLPLGWRRGPIGCLSAATIASWLVAAVFATAATHKKARLIYELGPGTDHCPPQQALENAVYSRLGYFPFQEAAEIIVFSSVRRDGHNLRGLVEFQDTEGRPRGRRELASSGDCDSLVESMAVAVSLGLDPPRFSATPSGLPSIDDPHAASVIAPVESRPASAASSVPSAVPPTSPAPSGALSVSTPPPSDAWRSQILGGSFVSTGLTPAAGIGLLGGLGLRFGSYSLGMEGHVHLPASTSTQGGTIEASLLSGWLQGCAHKGMLAGCGLAGFGSIQVEGSGVEIPRRDRTWYGGVGGRLSAQMDISGAFFVRAHGDIIAALTRTSFYLDNRVGWTSSPVQFAAGAALGANIP